MRGIAFTGNRNVDFITVDDPTPDFGEVVIEIKASGMCGSDLHDYRANADSPEANPTLIRGHEPAGVVIAAGKGVDKRFSRSGTRVMVHHYWGCTTCNQCRTGWPQLCTEVTADVYGSNAHGCHADYMKVPAGTLVTLHDSLSFAAGAAISCGTGTAWGALTRLGASGRDTIAVFGQGPVGLSATMIAAAQGLRVIALDLEQSRLALAREFGADETINVKDHDALTAIREFTNGKGVELSLDTSGAASAGKAALDCLDVWGKACLVGLTSRAQLSLLDYIDKQISVMTSWSMSSTGQKELADFVVSRNLDLDRLFTDRWSFDQAAEAYASFDRQASGKGVFII